MNILTIIHSKKSVWFNLTNVIAVIETATGTSVFTTDGEEWCLLEELAEVVNAIQEGKK